MPLGRCGPLGPRTRYRQEYPKMATDPETNRKLHLSRRDAMRAIAFGAAVHPLHHLPAADRRRHLDRRPGWALGPTDEGRRSAALAFVLRPSSFVFRSSAS